MVIEYSIRVSRIANYTTTTTHHDATTTRIGEQRRNTVGHGERKWLFAYEHTSFWMTKTILSSTNRHSSRLHECTYIKMYVHEYIHVLHPETFFLQAYNITAHSSQSYIHTMHHTFISIVSR